MESLCAALESLARGETIDLNAFFYSVETNVSLEGTAATCHFHCIHLDGNGRPRVDALIKHLVNEVVDYAIPRKRIQEAVAHQQKTGSTAKMVSLIQDARGLFSNVANSGEGGELILFMMAERFLKLPQIICKMSLKTSSQMHFHGADGVHAGVDTSKQKLCLYWGESKIYGTPTKAVYECMKSIAPFLLGTGNTGSSEERDLQLLSQFMNIDDPALEAALKKYLDPGNPQFCAAEFRGLCLVGFNSDAYPNEPNKSTIEDVKNELKSQLDTWKSLVGKRLLKEKIDSFSVHVFLLPFPSVDNFRDNLRHALAPSSNGTQSAS